MLASVQHEPPFERVIGPPPAAEFAHAADGVACRLCAGQDPAAAAARRPGRAPRLEQALDAALRHHRLTLLVAPAGYGKTAALTRQIRLLPRGQCAGLDLRRRGRPAAALPGLPVHCARAPRPALARFARRAGYVGAGRAWPARRGRRAGQRAGRHRGAARADRPRRRPPHGRPAGLRAAASGDRAPARALGVAIASRVDAAAVAGAAARQLASWPSFASTPCASVPAEVAALRASSCRRTHLRTTAQHCCSAPRAGPWAAPEPERWPPVAPVQAAPPGRRGAAPPVRLPGRRGAGRHAGRAAAASCCAARCCPR